MRRYKIFVLAVLLASIARIACAQSASSADLINNAKQYDGNAVNYQGEVIGDIMTRGQYAWINVNDGQNAIGIWIPEALTKTIAYKGGYGFKGDIFEVNGVFHRSCPEHGGDLDIHAQTIRNIQSGGQIPHNVDSNKIKIAFMLAGVLIFILFLNLLLVRKS